MNKMQPMKPFPLKRARDVRWPGRTRGAMAGLVLLAVMGSVAPAHALEWANRNDWKDAIPEPGTVEGRRLADSFPALPSAIPRYTVALVLGEEIFLGRLDDQFDVGTGFSVGLEVLYRLRRRRGPSVDIELAVSQTMSSPDGIRSDGGDRAEDMTMMGVGVGARVGFRKKMRLRPFGSLTMIYRSVEVETKLDTIDITGWGGRLSGGVDYAFGKNRKTVLSTSLAFDRWHGRDSDNGEGIEDALVLAISIGRRF